MGWQTQVAVQLQAGDTIINPNGVFVYSGTPAAGNLIASIAPAGGTDSFGNSYAQGVQVGAAANNAQVLILPGPGSGAAEIQFPPTSLTLSNIPNIAASSGAAPAELIMSGPALNTAGDKDWVQIVAFSNDTAGTPARMEFRYISNAQAVTTVASYSSTGWAFGGADPLPIAGVSASMVALPTDNNSGSTWVSGERAFMNTNWVGNINSNIQNIVQALINAGIVT